MKRTSTFLLLSVLTILLCTSSIVEKSSSGIAGFTGSPGEATCTNCHGGGSSASTNVTVTANPSFTNDQYMPDSIYQVTITVNAAGFNRYGFGCEILDSLNQNAGNIQTAGSGVKFLFSGPRKNAVHTGPKFGSGGTTFSFNWVAPSEGKATFYVMCNAVNFNNNTSGDLPIPYTKELYPAPQEELPDTTGINEFFQLATDVRLYPNPASHQAQISYHLLRSANVQAELINLQGAVMKVLFTEKQNTGDHSKILDLSKVASGVYFLRLNGDGSKITQKLLTIE